MSFIVLTVSALRRPWKHREMNSHSVWCLWDHSTNEIGAFLLCFIWAEKYRMWPSPDVHSKTTSENISLLPLRDARTQTTYSVGIFDPQNAECQIPCCLLRPHYSLVREVLFFFLHSGAKRADKTAKPQPHNNLLFASTNVPPLWFCDRLHWF